MDGIKKFKQGNEMRKILFVDDDPEWNEALKTYLKKENMDVKSFKSGEDFLEDFERSKEIPDLIILDIDLKIGGISGVEVAHRLRTHYMLNTPILFLSAEPHLDIWKQKISYSRSLSKKTSFRKLIHQLINDPILMN